MDHPTFIGARRRRTVIGVSNSTVDGCGQPSNKFEGGDETTVQLPRTEGYATAVTPGGGLRRCPGEDPVPPPRDRRQPQRAARPIGAFEAGLDAAAGVPACWVVDLSCHSIVVHPEPCGEAHGSVAACR
jgi:hypothetical protein